MSKQGIDGFLDTASQFDLFTVGWAFLEDLWHGSPADFGVAACIADKEIKAALNRDGVQFWGMMLGPDASFWMFTCRSEDAFGARIALGRHNIPILYMPKAALTRQERRTMMKKAVHDLLELG